MDANSLLFSISSAMTGQTQLSGSQAAAGLGLVENGVNWQGLSLAGASESGDFSSVLKAMIMTKLKTNAESGADLEKILVKITQKDAKDQLSGQELLSALLAALLPQLVSGPDLLAKLKASASGAGDASSDEALLKQKIVELLSNLKEGTQAADILSELAKNAAQGSSADKNAQAGNWREVLAQMLVVHLKSAQGPANAMVKVMAKAQEVLDHEAGKTDEAAAGQTAALQAQEPAKEGASLYEKLLSLLQAAGQSRRSAEAFHTAQAYGLQSEGMLSNDQGQLLTAKGDVASLDTAYMTLPKPDHFVKELGLAFGSGKKDLDHGAQDFPGFGSGAGLIKGLDGSLDNQALQVEKARVDMVQNLRAQEVVDQVAAKIQASIKEGVQEALVELRPEHLGKALMKVSLDHGRLSVRFEVSNHMVKETLESNFSMLKDSLKEKGYNMDHFSVSVNTNTHGNGQEPRQQFVQPQAHAFGWLDESEPEMEVAGVLGAQTVSVPNYYVEQALVNYLI